MPSAAVEFEAAERNKYKKCSGLILQRTRNVADPLAKSSSQLQAGALSQHFAFTVHPYLSLVGMKEPCGSSVKLLYSYLNTGPARGWFWGYIVPGRGPRGARAQGTRKSSGFRVKFWYSTITP